MRVPLPGPAPLVLWRASSSGTIGAQIHFTGADGLGVFEALAGDREQIAREFAEAGLPEPEWKPDSDDAYVSVTLPSPLPWTEVVEDEQIEKLGALANRFVNSFRPRLLKLTGEDR